MPDYLILLWNWKLHVLELWSLERWPKILPSSFMDPSTVQLMSPLLFIQCYVSFVLNHGKINDVMQTFSSHAGWLETSGWTPRSSLMPWQRSWEQDSWANEICKFDFTTLDFCHFCVLFFSLVTNVVAASGFSFECAFMLHDVILIVLFYFLLIAGLGRANMQKMIPPLCDWKVLIINKGNICQSPLFQGTELLIFGENFLSFKCKSRCFTATEII